MIEKTSTLYKMMILYTLERVDFPLSNTQITNLFLDCEYTTYFHVQEALHELLDSNLLQEKKQGNTTLYVTTPSGRETLSFFENNIPEQIRREIRQYMKDKKYELKNEHSVLADYYRTPEQEYVVHCQVREGKSTLINLELTVPTEETAQLFCRHWAGKSPDIYAYLMEALS